MWKWGRGQEEVTVIQGKHGGGWKQGQVSGHVGEVAREAIAGVRSQAQ